MKKNMISIIVPIYNSEEFLVQCLDSISNQTYKKIEIILINDGSTDNSLEICKKYQELDSRFVIINNNNNGVSYSRNCGIQNATGEFIMFVDSDDIIDKNMCEILLKNIRSYNSQLSCCDFIEKNNNFVFEYNNEINVSSSNLYKLLLEKYRGFLWNKLYISKIINDNKITFDTSISFGEDLLFNVNYMKYVKSTVYDDSKLYGYRIIQNSLSRKKTIQCLDIVKVYNTIVNDKEIDSISLSIYVSMYLIILFQTIHRLKQMHLNIEDVFRKHNINYKNEIHRYYFNALFSKNTNLFIKIKLIVYRYFPWMIYLIK